MPEKSTKFEDIHWLEREIIELEYSYKNILLDLKLKNPKLSNKELNKLRKSEFVDMRMKIIKKKKHDWPFIPS